MADRERLHDRLAGRVLVRAAVCFSATLLACGSGSDESVPQRTQPAPFCSGTATPCASLYGVGCQSALGCVDNSYCTGVTPTCSSQHTQSGCDGLDGCFWSVLDEDCTGSTTLCMAVLSESSCYVHSGCYWSSSCLGAASRCDTLHVDTCDQQPGCFVVGTVPDAGSGGTGGFDGGRDADAGSDDATSETGTDATCESSCNGSCVDLMSDSQNCGACGHACPPKKACEAGACTCIEPGSEACGELCRNLSTDPANCGACDHACLPGEQCTLGQCVCESDLVCNGACVPSDMSNCGACGNSCFTWDTCSSGQCACYSYRTRCDSACVDLDDDEEHCGSCHNACHPGELCSSGECRCPSWGDIWCPGPADCIDANSDDANCGDCGVVCTESSTCQGGTCRCTESGMTLCGQDCVDLLTDVAHCGDCDNACPPNYECSNGTCLCPTPVVGTAVRITDSSETSGLVSAAWDGVHVGVTYVEDDQIYVTLLNPDGTRATPTDTTLPHPYGETIGYRPRIVWNGGEYAIVWSTYVRTRFARVSSSGALIGAPVQLAGASWSPGIAWSPSYGGYGVSLGSSTNQVRFQRLGADASSPDAPVPVEVGFGHQTALAIAPDGSWQLAASVNSSSYPAGLRIVRFTAAGTQAAPFSIITDNTHATPASPEIVYDGSAFLKAWIIHTSHRSYVLASRDTSSQTALLSVPNVGLNPEHNIGSVAVEVETSPVIAIGWSRRQTPTTSYEYRMARYTVPSGTGNPTALTHAASVLPTNNIPSGQPVSLVSTGTYSMLAVWSDDRWGPDEVYAAPIDLMGCP